MNKRSKDLFQSALNFINESKLNIICAYIGGSVGRGEADTYSDLDLSIYTDSYVSSNHLNLFYQNEIFQVDIINSNELPSKQNITQYPWDYRFLNEIVIVKDKDDILQDIKKFATHYFSSDKSKEKILKQVSNIAEERKRFALDCLEQNKKLSATHACMGAWSESALLYLFCKHNSVSTGSLIPQLQKVNSHINRFKCVAPFSLEHEPNDVSTIIKNFRNYLRRQGYSNEFALSEVQDTLCENKIKRLLNKRDYLNLFWQMYGEALWLYFETSNGISFEKYFEELPITLQEDLSKIGFIPFNEENVKELCTLSDELLALSC